MAVIIVAKINYITSGYLETHLFTRNKHTLALSIQQSHICYSTLFLRTLRCRYLFFLRKQ